MRFKRRKKIVNYPFNWLNIVKDTNQTLFFSDWHQLIQSVHGIQGCVYAPVSSFLIFQYFHNRPLSQIFLLFKTVFRDGEIIECFKRAREVGAIAQVKLWWARFYQGIYERR